MRNKDTGEEKGNLGKEKYWKSIMHLKIIQYEKVKLPSQSTDKPFNLL